MYNGGKIIAGLIIGIGLLLSPFILNVGKASKAPELELTPRAKAAKVCVAPTAYMRRWHMQLLDEWRQSAVRDDDWYYSTKEDDWWNLRFDMGLLDRWRYLVAGDEGEKQDQQPGKIYYKSLEVTCMDCHSNKTKFCDRCHNYMAVTPYCWDCHIEPKENS
jgi:hypothetical protein